MGFDKFLSWFRDVMPGFLGSVKGLKCIVVFFLPSFAHSLAAMKTAALVLSMCLMGSAMQLVSRLH